MQTTDRAANMAVVSSIEADSANTSNTNGSSADRALYNSISGVIDTGTITDGTHTFDVEVSDDDSNWSSADAADYEVYGNDNSLAIESDDDDTFVYVNYHGLERYVRFTVTVSGSPGTGGICRAYWILQDPQEAPVNS